MSSERPRRRRTPDVLRRETIDAARSILLVEGPAGLTLQNIAAAAGVTHGNITHHFGSISKLQTTLADVLIGELVDAVRHGVLELRSGIIDERELVNLVFDQFEKSGTGRLFGWLAAQGHPQLGSMYDNFSRLLSSLDKGGTELTLLAEGDLPGIVYSVVIAALGASLIGHGLASALNLPVTHARSTTAAELIKQRRAREPLL